MKENRKFCKCSHKSIIIPLIIFAAIGALFGVGAYIFGECDDDDLSWLDEE